MSTKEIETNNIIKSTETVPVEIYKEETVDNVLSSALLIVIGLVCRIGSLKWKKVFSNSCHNNILYFI